MYGLFRVKLVSPRGSTKIAISLCNLEQTRRGVQVKHGVDELDGTVFSYVRISLYCTFDRIASALFTHNESMFPSSLETTRLAVSEGQEGVATAGLLVAAALAWWLCGGGPRRCTPPLVLCSELKVIHTMLDLHDEKSQNGEL